MMTTDGPPVCTAPPPRSDSVCPVRAVLRLIVALSLPVLPAAGQATITVTSTADTAVPFDAHCTLREALTNANTNTDTTANDCAAGTSTGTDTIAFNLVLGGGGGGPVRTIKPGSALPVITDPVVIDGETFGGADCGSDLASRTLTVELDGSSSPSGSGLALGAGSGGSTIRGLVINQWPGDGIRISGSDYNVVECNFIGTDASGTADLGNFGGVYIDSGTGNTIGGTEAGAGNLISGNNSWGVGIGGDNNTVAGNFIGTDVTGTADLGNTGIGVSINGMGNTIGGEVTGARNLISGNNGPGVRIFSSDNNTVAGNFIGTDASGTADLGNSSGVYIDSGSMGNTIGGTAAGATNVIAFNHWDGVVLLSTAGTGNAIQRNRIFNNTQLGIDLGDDGITANDPSDSDTGPNKLQNFPTLTALDIIGGNLLVTYSVDTDPANATYPLSVEVFEADADDQEGKTFLGSDSYSIGEYPGVAQVNLGAAASLGVSLGDRLVTTATDADGNTSEFSGPFVTGTVTRYVAPTGGDTNNDCTNPLIPCATLGHAVGQANAGDTVDVAAGTYTEPGLVLDKALHFRGQGVIVQ